MYEAALAAQAAYWGGSGNLVFPIEGFVEQELFWRLGDVFDADAFVIYEPTWDEWAEIAPAAHKRTMEKLRRDVTKQHGESLANEFVAGQGKERVFHLKLRDEHIDVLVDRLAPFHHDTHRYVDAYDGINEPAWPFTDVRKFVDLPSKLTTPISPQGASRKLLLTACIGRLGHVVQRQLTEREIEIAEEDLRKTWRWAEFAVDRRRARRADHPWALSEVGLARYRRAPLLDKPAALVVGNSPWDFTLFYALKHLTGMAWWLPSWLERDQVYMHTLGSALEYEPRGEGRDLVIVSASSLRARDRVARTIERETSHHFNAHTADWRDVLPDQPLRLYELDNAGRYEPIEVIDGATLPLDTPLPRQVATATPTEMRWMTEVQARDWAAARDARLPRALLSEIRHGSDTMRTTRDGIAYFGPDILIFGGASLESSVIRPILHPLEVIDQVEAVLRPAGWSCTISDKGIYARESMALFRGFDGLVEAMRDPERRQLMNAFTARSGPGQLLTHDNRRYLTWKNLQDVADRFDPADALGDLLERRVLSRGIVLRCRRCRQKAWHDIAAVGEDFTCRRCRLTQPMDRESWGDYNEPRWTYQLAEVVFQFLTNNGDLPLVAVSEAFAGTNRPFQHGYELDVTGPSGDSKEVDIFALDGYRLWIGEATTTGRFEAGRMEFLRELASVTRAYGVLLATTKSRFAPATGTEIRNVFSDPWPRLQLSTAVQVGP